MRPQPPCALRVRAARALRGCWRPSPILKHRVVAPPTRWTLGAPNATRCTS
jgi:hypothetical protein